jgi:hypothetical protein
MEQMPSMDWDSFQDAHYRPHLVVATLEPGLEPVSDETTVALFERLAMAFGMSGNYAFKKDGANIHAAFEIDTEAERFAGLLQAKTTTCEPEWASRSVGRIDGAAQRRIIAAVRQRGLKRARRQSGSDSSVTNGGTGR